MPRPRLTVVVPTRNRRDSLLRLLNSITSQTLSPAEFEVVIVDDGSEPPLDPPSVAGTVPFVVRMIRRTVQPGAHESRCAGAQEARGSRVLFLDDDVVLDPTVLAAHATVEGEFAIGPILYHPASSTTPHHRYKTRLYAEYVRAVARQGSSIPASEIYICNASGPTDEFVRILEGVGALLGGMPVPGDGCDEELMDYQLKGRGMARFLPDAVALHIDTKTIEQARRERRLHGATQCRLILKFPDFRPSFDSHAILTGGLTSYRTWRVKFFWLVPRLFGTIANGFTWLADRGPARWVPAWTCYPPLAIAFWEGMKSAAPSYRQLRAALLDRSGSNECRSE